MSMLGLNEESSGDNASHASLPLAPTQSCRNSTLHGGPQVSAKIETWPEFSSEEFPFDQLRNDANDVGVTRTRGVPNLLFQLHWAPGYRPWWDTEITTPLLQTDTLLSL